MQTLPIEYLRFFESLFLKKNDFNSGKGIFIFALPRSGSTLTFQVLAHCFETNYLSNIWNLLCRIPYFGGSLSLPLAKKYYSDFQSNIGFVPGLSGPSEGFAFWNYWINSSLSDSYITDFNWKKKLFYLKSVFLNFESIGYPFSTAYLGHTLIPNFIVENFPESIFIRIKRDPISNGLSILNQMEGKNWFSIVPNECKSCKFQSRHEMVASQVYWLNKRLDSLLTNYIVIQYENLCNNPHFEMQRIQKWCKSKGLKLKIKNIPPLCFNYKIADIEKNRDARLINNALKELEKRFGKLS